MTQVLLVPDLPAERWRSMDRYASRLWQHLQEVAPDLELELATGVDELTLDSATHHDDASGASRDRRPPRRLARLRRFYDRYRGYPRRVRSMRADVVHVLDHSYAHMLEAATGVPRIVTVHDLVPVQSVSRPARGMRERIRNLLLAEVLLALRTADAWIVGTEWLRSELRAWLGLDHRISVIPFGVDSAYFDPPGEGSAAFRHRVGIPETAFVILHVGSVEPRKNFEAVLAALHQLRRGGLDAWVAQVGGRPGQHHRRDMETRGIEGHVVFLGPVPEVELRSAYRAADVLLFPSHIEGFGLPVLEAMASGVPVVTSGAGALTEVSGEAAVIVSEGTSAAYSEALERLATDNAWYADLVSRGHAHARRFTWRETARRTAELYRAHVGA